MLTRCYISRCCKYTAIARCTGIVLFDGRGIKNAKKKLLEMMAIKTGITRIKFKE
jgi:hypothetical protein